jgi:hypothetical protein
MALELCRLASESLNKFLPEFKIHKLAILYQIFCT